MDSLDIFLGFTGQSRQCTRKIWTDSREQGRQDSVYGQCPMSPWTMSTGLSGHCSWIQWSLSSSVSLNIVHGLSGRCPWTPWTLASLDIFDIVHGLWTFPWTQWALSMDFVPILIWMLSTDMDNVHQVHGLSTDRICM